jgi:uncharacterized membrane protein
VRDPKNVCINLFLALIPVALGLAIGWLSSRDKKFSNKWYVWLPLLTLWLGFLPNTCYLLTEWRHFIEAIISEPDRIRIAAHNEGALLDFLALSTFYILYSGLGLLTFSMALWPVVRWLNPSRLSKFLFFFVCSLGVYLGLIKRFNTWDVLHIPSSILISVGSVLGRPFTVMLIIGFAFVLWANFWVFAIFIDGVILRLRRTSNRSASKA